MLRFVARRLLEAIPVLFVIATATFFMLKLAPGGPYDQERATTPEIKEQTDKYYGFDKPWLTQYLILLKGYLQGNLGIDYRYANRTVAELIAGAFPVSLELGVLSLAIAIVIGMTAGLLAAMKQNTVVDYGMSSLAMIGICLPTFVLGPVLV